MLQIILNNLNDFFNYITFDFFNDNDLKHILLVENLNNYYQNLEPIEQIRKQTSEVNLNNVSNELLIQQIGAENNFNYTIEQLISQLTITEDFFNHLNDQTSNNLKQTFSNISSNLDKSFQDDLNDLFKLNFDNELFCLNESNSILLWETTNNLNNLNTMLENLSIFKDKNKFLSMFEENYKTSFLKDKWKLKNIPTKLNAYGLWENLFNADLSNNLCQERLNNLEELKKLTLKTINKWINKKL